MKNFLLGSLVLCAVAAPALAQSFQEVAASTGISAQHEIGTVCGTPPIGTGSAWADYDNDGDVDLFVTNQSGPNQLYRNDGDMTNSGLPDFSDQAASLGLQQELFGSFGTVFVDYDNDGDQDLYVGNWGGNTLFQNQLSETGSVSFVDVTASAGVGDDGRMITAAWADFDRDGYLDLYLAKHAECIDDPQSRDALFRNNGDGSFQDVTLWLCGGSSSCPEVEGLAFSAGWFDYDGDGDEDLYVVNDNIDGLYYPNVMWRNDGPDGLGGWLFEDTSKATATDFSVNGMGLAIGDADNDGWLDLAFSNVGPNKLLANAGDGTFVDVSVAAGIERATHENGESITWATSFFDYNNDQLLDLFIASGYISAPAVDHPNAFFSNNGDKTFTDESAASGLDHPGRARGASLADFNGDGFVDLFVTNYGEKALLYENTAVDQVSNGWLSLEVEGSISNRDGIGSVVTVTTPDGVVQQRLVSSGPTHGGGDQRRAFFGLGDQQQADVVVRWPSGIQQSYLGVAPNQHELLVEPAIRLELSLRGAPKTNRTNDFKVSGAAIEGASVVLNASLFRGASPLDGCKGVDVDSGEARQLDEVTVDENGAAELGAFVPATAEGRTVFFQAVMPKNCAVSNVVEVVFP